MGDAIVHSLSAQEVAERAPQPFPVVLDILAQARSFLVELSFRPEEVPFIFEARGDGLLNPVHDVLIDAFEVDAHLPLRQQLLKHTLQLYPLYYSSGLRWSRFL